MARIYYLQQYYQYHYYLLATAFIRGLLQMNILTFFWIFSINVAKSDFFLAPTQQLEKEI